MRIDAKKCRFTKPHWLTSGSETSSLRLSEPTVSKSARVGIKSTDARKIGEILIGGVLPLAIQESVIKQHRDFMDKHPGKPRGYYRKATIALRLNSLLDRVQAFCEEYGSPKLSLSG